MPRLHTKKKTLATTMILLVTALLLVSYQNCTGSALFENAQTQKASGGNGDGYQGKPTIYDYYSRTNPCAEIGASGQALPNEEVFVFSSLKAQLVRRNCQDIPPIALNSTDFTLSSDSRNLTYGGNAFAQRTGSTDFDVVAAKCPIGSSPIAGAVRTNLFADSQDLNGASWSYHPGVASLLNGTIGGLPRYSVYRAAPPFTSNWYRPSKLLNLKVGTRYAYTFIAEKQINETAFILIWQWQGADVVIHQNLTNGALNIVQTNGVANFSTDVSRLGSGFVTTIYFDALSANEADLGVTPLSAAQNESIFTTAFQLEEVGSFCR